MTTRKIKIVKWNAPAPEPLPVREEQADTDRRIANGVKKWISERRENSVVEKVSQKRRRKTKVS
jgi:hypothetical protein